MSEHIKVAVNLGWLLEPRRQTIKEQQTHATVGMVLSVGSAGLNLLDVVGTEIGIREGTLLLQQNRIEWT